MIIVWDYFMRRAESISTIMDIPVVYLGRPSNKKILTRVKKYFTNFFKTLYLALFKTRNDILILELPPTLMLGSLILVKILKPKIKIISDCHNGVFYSFWKKTPFLESILSLSDIVMVHNQTVYNDVLNHYPKLQKKLKVVPDPPAKVKDMVANDKSTNTFQIVFPCSFRFDEPIENILELTKKFYQFKIHEKDIQFIITGSYKHTHYDFQSLNANVILTGYLDIDHFNRLLHNADIIVGLTTEDNIQLCVANEAVGFGKAVILSNTTASREYFSDFAYFTENDPDSLFDSINFVLTHLKDYQQKSQMYKEIKSKEWHNTYQSLFRK